MAENSDHLFQFGLAIVAAIVGGLLTGLPALWIANRQIQHEERQYLLDRRVTALRDFATAINDGNRLISLSWTVDGELADAIATIEVKRRYDGSPNIDKFLTEDANFVGAIRTQEVVIDAVFGVSIIVPPPPDLPPVREYKTWQDAVAGLRSARESNSDFRIQMAKLIDSYQRVLDSLAGSLKTPS